MLSGDVTFARVISLFHLHHHDSQTIAELAEATGLSHAAASRMVDGLYREGVVDRREAAEDRRQKCVELTPAGLKKIEAMRQVTTEAYAEMMPQVPKGTTYQARRDPDGARAVRDPFRTRAGRPSA